MSGLNARMRGWLVWLLPFIVLALVIGWEADWGRKWRHVPVTDAVVAPQPVVVAVLPEYKPTATLATQRDMVDRALFNPTRRPAPVADGGRETTSPVRAIRAHRHVDHRRQGHGVPARKRRRQVTPRRPGRADQWHAGRRSEARPRQADTGRRSRGPGPQGRHRPEDNDAAGRRTRRQAPLRSPEAARRPPERQPPIRWPNAVARNRRPRQRLPRPRPAAGRLCSTLRPRVPSCLQLAPPRRRGAAQTDPRWAETDARIRARSPGGAGRRQSK